MTPLLVLGIGILVVALLAFVGFFNLLRGKTTLESLSADYNTSKTKRVSRLKKERDDYIKLQDNKSLKGKIAVRLWRSGVNVSPTMFLFASVGLMVLLFLIGMWLFHFEVSALIFAFMGWVLPEMFLEARAGKARTKYMEQFEIALENISNSLRLGKVPLVAIAEVTKDIEDPVKSDLEEAVVNVSEGMSLGEALESLAWRRGIKELEQFAVAVSLGEERGGNLDKEIYQLSKDIGEERVAAKRARAELGSAFLMNIVAFGMLFGIYLFMKTTVTGMAQQLYGTSSGHKATIMVAMASIIQLYFMRAVTRIRSA